MHNFLSSTIQKNNSVGNFTGSGNWKGGNYSAVPLDVTIPMLAQLARLSFSMDQLVHNSQKWNQQATKKKDIAFSKKNKVGPSTVK